MNEFKKQVAILRDLEGRIIGVLDIKTIEHEQEYKDLKERAKNNLEMHYKNHEQNDYERNVSVNKKINDLAQVIDVFIKK